MEAKFFGDSYFGGDFLIKNSPLSEENPPDNKLKLSFQEIGNNLVITALNSEGKTLTVFGVADTTSVSFDVEKGVSGTYSDENENIHWEWDETDENTLIIHVFTYGFLKTVIFDESGYEVSYPIIVNEDTNAENGEKEQGNIKIVFPENSLKHQIKLLYSYNGLDVCSTLGDVALRNIGKESGHVPVVESNNRLPMEVISYVKVYNISSSGGEVFINYNNGNLQIIKLERAVNFSLNKYTSKMENGDRVILQVNNPNGYGITINGKTLFNTFYGVYNLEFVKVNNNIQYWGMRNIQEI